MASINKVILVGNLGKDPDIRFTKSDSRVATFSLATTEAWTKKDGGKGERTEWHNIVIWGKLAKVCEDYLHKGSQVYLEGKLQTRTWEDREGQKRYTTEVVCHTMQMLGGKKKEEPREVEAYPEPSEESIPF